MGSYYGETDQDNDPAYRVPFDLDPKTHVPETDAIPDCGTVHGYVLLTTNVRVCKPWEGTRLGKMPKASKDVLGDALCQLGGDKVGEPVASFDHFVSSNSTKNDGLYITRLESYSCSSGYIEAFPECFYPIEHQSPVRLGKVVV